MTATGRVRWLLLALLLAGCSSSRGGGAPAPEGCPNGKISCQGACVDTSSDAANCGACGNVCLGMTQCVSGSCRMLCNGTPCGPGQVVWSRFLPNTTKNSPTPATEGGIAIDNQGNTLIGGSFWGTLDLGSLQLTSEPMVAGIVEASLDRHGKTVWGRHFEGTGPDFINGLAADAQGDVLSVGQTPMGGGLDFGNGPLDQFALYLTKLDKNGKFVSTKSWDQGVSLDSLDAIVTNGANMFVLGAGDHPPWSANPYGCTSSSTGSGFYVAKFDAAVNNMWTTVTCETVEQYGTINYALAVGGDGSAAVAGSFEGSLQAGPTLLTGPISNARSDAFVLKLTPQGPFAWSTKLASDQTVALSGVGMDAKGNVVVAGSYMGTATLDGTALGQAGPNGDLLIAKLDGKTGARMWSRSLPMSSGWGLADVQDEAVNSLALDAQGNIAVIGTFENTVSLGGPPVQAHGPGIFVAKFDSKGTPLWSRGFGWQQNDANVPVMTMDPAGAVAVLADTNGSVDLGKGPLWPSNPGAIGFTVAMFAP